MLYGAAEFSRDTDFAVLSDAHNLLKISEAMDHLRANVIAVPPFSLEYLEKGHAVHFRCFHPEAYQMRVDVMSVMRGVDDFSALWCRRTSIEVGGGVIYEVLGLPDLVRAKKTQRDKDWPMIQRLVETNYLAHRDHSTREQIEFWIREARTPQIIEEINSKYSVDFSVPIAGRGEVFGVAGAGREAIITALKSEQEKEQAEDRRYWSSLKKELEQMRHEDRCIK